MPSDLSQEPTRIRYTEEFPNWEPAPDELMRHELTRNDVCFVRSHGPTPVIDAGSYRLSVDGLVEQPQQLSLTDMASRFKFHEVTCAIMCAGNRRTEFLKVGNYPGEVNWDLGAMANVRWGGYLLRDVLAAAIVRSGALHVRFEGADDCVVKGQTIQYGTSIPLATAMESDALLVTHMNGELLPPDHGYPIRMVVPGHIGAKAVKWLRRIELSTDTSPNYYHAKAYRMVPVGSDDWAGAEPIERFPITSAICNPGEGATVDGPEVNLAGYAASGNGAIARVEVSSDEGRSWTAASLKNEPLPYAWTLWTAKVSLGLGKQILMVRATDSAGNSQPDRMDEIVNLKGYLNNAVQRVEITVQ